VISAGWSKGLFGLSEPSGKVAGNTSERVLTGVPARICGGPPATSVLLLYTLAPT